MGRDRVGQTSRRDTLPIPYGPRCGSNNTKLKQLVDNHQQKVPENDHRLSLNR